MKTENQEIEEGFGVGIMTEADLESLNKRFRRFLWFEPIGSKRRMICTACRKEMTVSRMEDGFDAYEAASAKHGSLTHCPNCGLLCEVKSINRSLRRSVYGERKTYVRVIKKSHDEVVINCYVCEKHYDKECAFDSLPSWYMTDSYLLQPGTKAYQYGRKTVIEPFLDGYAMGMKHLPYELPKYPFKGTFLENCGMWEYNKGRFDVGKKVTYLCEFCEKPGLEQLTKAGYIDLVAAYINGNHFRGKLNLRGKNPQEILRMSRAEANILKSNTIGPMGGVLRDYFETCKKVGITLLDLKDFKDTTHLSYYAISELIKVYSNIKKLIRYLERQLVKEQEAFRAETVDMCHAGYGLVPSMNGIAQMLIDYRRMANQAHYRVEDFPKDLFRAHSALLEEETNRKEKEYHEQAENRMKAERKSWENANKARMEKAVATDEAFKEKLAKNQRRRIKLYGAFHDDKYMIVVPENAQALVDEGRALHHCVGTYAEAFDKNMSDIVFIRRIDHIDQPLLTVEVKKDVKGYKITQCYGFNDDRQLFTEDQWLAPEFDKWLKIYDESCRAFAQAFGDFVENIGKRKKEDKENGTERKRA